jgi:hypothetical protein
VTVARQDGGGEPVARGSTPTVVAAGEPGWIRFEEIVEDAAGAASAAQTTLIRLLLSGDDLVAEVTYSDQAGRQKAAPSLYLTRSGRTDPSTVSQEAIRATRTGSRLSSGYNGTGLLLSPTDKSRLPRSHSHSSSRLPGSAPPVDVSGSVGRWELEAYQTLEVVFPTPMVLGPLAAAHPLVGSRRLRRSAGRRRQPLRRLRRGGIVHAAA